jgi:hypothetical protein
MDFGFVGSGASLYDLPALARHVEAAYRELESRAPKQRAARGRAARRNATGG